MSQQGYNGRGFEWTKEAEAYLRKLRIEGADCPEIIQSMNEKFHRDFTYAQIDQKLTKMKLRNLVQKIPGIKIYSRPHIPEDNYMISCDYHAPFHSELWVNRLLAVANRFEIKKHIIVGDLFDMDWAKSHPTTDGEQRPGLDGEKEQSDPIVKALLLRFDKNVHICGNHETRPARNVIRVQFRHVARYLGLDSAKERYSFSEYDQLEVGTKWLLVHPQSYSQISGSVAVRLAEKYHRHVLNAHGHFIALRWDRSGDYLAVDLGGMFDQRKVAYSSLHTTTHPFWNNGFGMIWNGHFYHFHQGTDWRFWLEGKNGS